MPHMAPRNTPAVALLLAWLALAPARALSDTPSPGQDGQPGPIQKYAEQLASDPAAALEQAARARDAALAAWPASGDGALVEAVEHHAVLEMLAKATPSARTLMASVWAAHPRFVGAVARIAEPGSDVLGIAAIAQGIAAQHGPALAEYPELAAAVCVVLARPRSYPGLGAVRPEGPEVFAAMVFAHQDRRVSALPLHELPAEVLVYLADVALTGEGVRSVVLDRRRATPLELYKNVPYVQAGLLAGEPALPPEEFTFDRIAQRGGQGPLRGFYAEQLGQAYGYPVALATGQAGQARFMAPVFLESPRRTQYRWNLEAIPDHPGVALGTAAHPVTGRPMPLDEVLPTADLARAGAEATRSAWALLRASELPGAAPEAAKALRDASQGQTMGLVDAWPADLGHRLGSAGGTIEDAQRVISEFFARTEEHSPLLAMRLVLGAIEGHEHAGELHDWLIANQRRDQHRSAMAMLARGDAALARGEREAAAAHFEDLVNRAAGDTPVALEGLARLEALAAGGLATDVLELYARTHRRLRPPRGDEALVRASAFMIVGERYEALLRQAGRDREADRLLRRLEQALP